MLYVAAEDPHGMRQRVTGLRLTHGDAPGFFLVEGVSDLLGKDSGDPAALRAVVERIRPALVVIDTVAVAFPGLRENESEDMSRVVTLARSLTEWGAAVVLVHHAPKGDDGTVNLLALGRPCWQAEGDAGTEFKRRQQPR